jgi:hypothetical protein
MLIATGSLMLSGCRPAANPVTPAPAANANVPIATEPSPDTLGPATEAGEPTGDIADSQTKETSPPVEPMPPPKEEIPAEVRAKLESLGARIIDKPNGYAIDIRRKPGFTDAEIDAVIECPEVVDLTMERVSITDAGLVKLKALPKLRRLILNDCPITGRGLETLAGLPLRDQLFSIGLRGSQVKDEDLVWLKDFPALERVDVSQTSLTDACLPALEMLPLVMLNVAQTKITSAGLAPLQQKHPKLTVNQ